VSNKRPADPRGGHARIYWSLLDSPAYLALSNSARALYVDLRRKLSANNNGNVEAHLHGKGGLVHRGWRSPATLFNALQELVAVGLLVQTRKGGIASMSKVCSLYRFTDEPVFEHPAQGVPAMKPTFDYLRFENLGHAKAAIREMRDSKRIAAVERKKSKLQKLNLQTTKTVAMAPIKATETEQRRSAKIQKLKLSKTALKAASA
jgi:hypothetical protein